MSEPTPVSLTASTLSEGQIWAYHTRAGEDGSTILINKIETHPKLGNIFHISIFGLAIANPNIAGGMQTEFGHIPVSAATLEKSLTTLQGMRREPHPEYYEGYAIWKKAFDQGEAGIFTIDIAEIVGVIEQAVFKNSQMPAS